eukprot:1468846-Rhodomonas_salina.1
MSCESEILTSPRPLSISRVPTAPRALFLRPDLQINLALQNKLDASDNPLARQKSRRRRRERQRQGRASVPTTQ